ncbi:Poly(A) polymerase [hydrothermal vent metagenome]|uniref:Poly(A) polymerase n=1 Tax=hydrothermal vent metagenome TaxID=652676 RepID=A0A3B0V9D9_9ZZZZ
MTNNKLQTYNQSHHGISAEQISPSARAIITKLLENGYVAYIVGGAVRDLLLGMHPKDFDIATNATPDQIKYVFQKHCRIIGRRFKLAHVYHNREMYEVATFRGVAAGGDRIVKQGHIVRDNVFGSIDQDAVRRDFTCNALYFDIENANILDFCNGVEDINQGRLRFIGENNQRIIEDPVRMIRAVRFQAKLGLNIPVAMRNAILQQSQTLYNVSFARLFDELVKVFHCGSAHKAYELMNELQLFQHIFPQAIVAINSSDQYIRFVHNALKSTDLRIKQQKSVTPIFLFACFLWPMTCIKINKYLAAGMVPYDAVNKAANQTFDLSRRNLSIPRIVQIGIRNIWLLQHRFSHTKGKKVFFTLEHPRFRAAYDFLLLRAHESVELQKQGDWWTHIQTISKAKQIDLIFSKKKTKYKK